MVSFFWGLGAFVFYKAALDLSFRSDVTVIAAALLGLMVAISVFASSYFYAIKSGTHLARVAMGTPSSYLFSIALVWLLTTAANIILAKILVFAFSKRLNNDLGYDLMFRGGSRTDEALTFCAIVAVPAIVHLLMILFGVSLRAKEVRGR